jgi:hypothetical protein
MLRTITVRAAVPSPWYKGQLKETLLDLKAGTPIWFKLNTEKPLSSGPSYWVFEPKTKTVRHLVEDIGDMTIKGERFKTGWAIANEQETESLNRVFGPIVRKIVSSPAWQNVGKPDNRKNQSFKLGYDRKPELEV